MVDGAVVPRDPFQPDAPAVSADVPMIGGSNLHDGNLNRTDFSMDENAAQEQLKTTLGNESGPRLGRLPRRRPEGHPGQPAGPHLQRPRRPRQHANRDRAQGRARQSPRRSCTC